MALLRAYQKERSSLTVPLYHQRECNLNQTKSSKSTLSPFHLQTESTILHLYPNYYTTSFKVTYLCYYFRGGKFLEAPVSGSKVPADMAQLIFLCAGDEEVRLKKRNDFV